MATTKISKKTTTGPIPLAQVRAAAAAAKAAKAAKAANGGRTKKVKKSVDEQMAAPVRKQVSKAKPKPSLAKKIAMTISNRVASSQEERESTLARPVTTSVKKNTKLAPTELKAFRSELLYMRNCLMEKIARQSRASLKREDDTIRPEEGTEAYERFFALENVADDRKVVLRIDEALRSIKEGSYGICGNCGSRIQKPRLQALPFAKLCIRCQALHEQRLYERDK